jgi:spore photoproduct lyase
MKIDCLLLEKNLLTHPSVERFQTQFPKAQLIEIDDYRHYFGSFKKPYLHKRTNLNIILAENKGPKVKIAPNAYGLPNEKHFYFAHAYNCPYECQYCYLQGYFQSPDLVFFLNHHEIAEEIKKTAENYPQETVWFHAGEFSDCLALSHCTREWNTFIPLFKEIPHAKLELRCKSSNLKGLAGIEPVDNVHITFSLAPEKQVKEFDLLASPLKARIQAMEELQKRGFKVGLHFDPLVYSPTFQEDFKELIYELQSRLNWNEIQYISLGVIRFPDQLFSSFKRNYPGQGKHFLEMKKTEGGLRRYSDDLREWMFKYCEDTLLSSGIQEKKVYRCMESIE